MAQILLGTLGIVAFSVLSWVVLLAAVASLHSLLAEALDSVEGTVSSSSVCSKPTSDTALIYLPVCILLWRRNSRSAIPCS